MNNFYFVCTFNLTSPKVKEYLTEMMNLDVSTTVDFKLRSKLISSYDATIAAAEDDFEKLPLFYVDEGDFKVQELLIINPVFAVSPEAATEAAEKFGQHTGTWDDHCASALYFIDDENHPSEWIMKYEVYYADDGIEYSKNGELERLLSVEKFPTLYH